MRVIHACLINRSADMFVLTSNCISYANIISWAHSWCLRTKVELKHTEKVTEKRPLDVETDSYHLDTSYVSAER